MHENEVTYTPANAPRASNAQQPAFEKAWADWTSTYKPTFAKAEWDDEDEQLFSEAWEAWTWE